MRKYKLTVNNTTVDVEVDGPKNDVLTISIGEASFPVQVAAGDSDSGKLEVSVGDMKHTVYLTPNPNTGDFSLKIEKNRFTVQLKAETVTPPPSFQQTQITPTTSTLTPTMQTPSSTIQEPTEPGTVVAPLPGRILDVRVKEGTTVKQGDVLLVLEAMKMANEIRAPQAGTIRTIHIEVGMAVEKGQSMISIQ